MGFGGAFAPNRFVRASTHSSPLTPSICRISSTANSPCHPAPSDPRPTAAPAKPPACCHPARA
eukprot:7263074-Prymnesium_polylepis.1